MGTNFYWISDPCAACGHSQESLHIGKSSAGWAFALRIHPDKGIRTLNDWKAKWAAGGHIRDEYDQEMTVEQMLDRITNRSHPLGLHFASDADEFSRHGLSRKRGEGTFEYSDYEFS